MTRWSAYMLYHLTRQNLITVSLALHASLIDVTHCTLVDLANLFLRLSVGFWAISAFPDALIGWLKYLPESMTTIYFTNVFKGLICTISWFDHHQFPVLNILQPPCNFSEECQLPMNASDFSAMSESGRGRMRPSIGAQMRRGGNKQTFLLSRTI